MDKSAPRTECGNCGATLSGLYCSACGQHAHHSARSLGALFHDAWHLFTHVDGRLWQSLYLLLLRPGILTQEYFAERRVRYLPPVRLYLVLSVLFFAFFFALSTDDEDRAPALSSGANSSAPAPVVQGREPGTAGDLAEKSTNTGSQGKRRGGFSLETSDCTKIHTSVKWLESPLRRACLHNVSSGGRAWTAAYLASVPKMLLVFVPISALVMLLLYWRPRRYYVEHLVFFLHNHAAVFLILLLQAVLGWLAALLGWRAFPQWVILFTTLYTIWYVYRAMRVYYAQVRWLTIAKFLVVGFAYTVGLTATLLATVIVSALTF